SFCVQGTRRARAAAASRSSPSGWMPPGRASLAIGILLQLDLDPQAQRPCKIVDQIRPIAVHVDGAGAPVLNDLGAAFGFLVSVGVSVVGTGGLNHRSPPVPTGCGARNPPGQRL